MTAVSSCAAVACACSAAPCRSRSVTRRRAAAHSRAAASAAASDSARVLASPAASAGHKVPSHWRRLRVLGGRCPITTFTRATGASSGRQCSSHRETRGSQQWCRPTRRLGAVLRCGAVQLGTQVRELRREAPIFVPQLLRRAVQPLPPLSGFIRPANGKPLAVLDCHLSLKRQMCWGLITSMYITQHPIRSAWVWVANCEVLDNTSMQQPAGRTAGGRRQAPAGVVARHPPRHPPRPAPREPSAPMDVMRAKSGILTEYSTT